VTRPAPRYHGVLGLVLLAFATALLAAGVPGLIAQYQTRSLQQELHRAGTLAGTVLGTSSFGQPLPGATLPSNEMIPDPSAMGQEATELGASVPAGVGAEPALAWGGVSTRNYLGAVLDGQPAELNLEYRTSNADEYRMVSGVFPSSLPAEQDGDPTYDVAVSEQTAQRFGEKAGTVIHAANAILVVTGVYEPEDTSSAYWAYDPALAEPDYEPAAKNAFFWQIGMMVGADEISALTKITTTAIAGQVAETDAFVFCVPLDTSGYDAQNAGALDAALSAYDTGQAGASLGLTLVSGPLDVLGPFQAERGTVDSILALMLTGVATVGAAAVLLCARLVVGRRHAHFALLRARGQSLRQLALQVAAGLAPPILAVLVAALALARYAVSAGPMSLLAWTLFAAVALVALTGPPLLAVFVHRGQASVGQDREDPVRRRPSARRRLGELAILLVCVGAVVALREQGLGEGNGPNLLGTLAPILTAAAATAIAVRCYPLFLRPAARAAAARRGPRGFLGLAGAARSPQAIAAPTFIIVLTLTLGALGVLMNRAVDEGRTAQSWLSNGADAVVSLEGTAESRPQTSAAAVRLGQASGVTHTAIVYAQADMDPTGGEDIAVDPDAYGAVTADSPWPFAGALPGRPVSGPVPVVVSQGLGKAVGARYTLTPMSGPPLDVEVVAVVPYTAAAPTGGTESDGGTAPQFTLLPTWAVAAAPQYWLPSSILLSGNGIDRKAVAAVVTALLPGGTVAYRQDIVAQLAAEPLQNLARFAYLIGVLAAACFGVCGILLSLTLSAGARNRRLSLLATLGLDPGQARGIALAETTPLAVAGVVGGLLSALALPAVFGSCLNLAVFTGLQTETGLPYDVATPLLTAAAAVVLTALGVAVQSWVAQRRSDVPTQLRIGDER
jgi:putative ABC transport system permease protein